MMVAIDMALETLSYTSVCVHVCVLTIAWSLADVKTVTKTKLLVS